MLKFVKLKTTGRGYSEYKQQHAWLEEFSVITFTDSHIIKLERLTNT